MEYYIGIDSGGTKTEFILADAEGSSDLFCDFPRC